MTSSAVSTELSVSLLSWINDQLREEVEFRTVRKPAAPSIDFLKTFFVAGVASLSLLLASIIAT